MLIRYIRLDRLDRSVVNVHKVALKAVSKMIDLDTG